MPTQQPVLFFHSREWVKPAQQKLRNNRLSQDLNAATEPPLQQVIGLPERDLLTMNRDTRIVLFLMGELIVLAVRAR